MSSWHAGRPLTKRSAPRTAGPMIRWSGAICSAASTTGPPSPRHASPLRPRSCAPQPPSSPSGAARPPQFCRRNLPPDGTPNRLSPDPQTTASEAKEPAAEVSRTFVYPVRGRKPKGGLGWFGWVTAVAAFVVAIYLGVHSLQLQHKLDASRGEVARLSAQAARAQELMEALTSPEAKQVTLTETKRPAQPVGHATYVRKTGALIFIASNLRRIPENKTYELWLIPANGKAPIPAGLFRPDASGAASVVLPPLPAGVKAKAFGVTVEVAEGSPTPTLPIVMAGQ